MSAVIVAPLIILSESAFTLTSPAVDWTAPLPLITSRPPALRSISPGALTAPSMMPSKPAVSAMLPEILVADLMSKRLLAGPNKLIRPPALAVIPPPRLLPTLRARLPLPIEVCVIDNGPGAPDEIADHLFDPFVSGKPEGQGLGLALVDKLVRDMGGVVQYAREGEPEMTVFRILLARAR